MATFIALKDRTASLVNGPGVVDIIPSLINQGVYEIAGGMLSTIASILTPPLPELFTIDTITTDINAAFVDMPVNFHRALQFVVSANGTEIDIAESFIDFAAADPSLSRTGNINEVIEHGKKLYYLNIPKISEEITLHYYREPVEMVIDPDEPDGIPEHLQVALLTNYAAWKAYEFIEDGLEGDTPNTLKYMRFFMTALRTLELSIPDYICRLSLR